MHLRIWNLFHVIGPVPGATEVNIVILKRVYTGYGPVYRFEKDITTEPSGWNFVTGGNTHEISYFRSFENRVEKEYSGWG